MPYEGSVLQATMQEVRTAITTALERQRRGCREAYRTEAKIDGRYSLKTADAISIAPPAGDEE